MDELMPNNASIGYLPFHLRLSAFFLGPLTRLAELTVAHLVLTFSGNTSSSDKIP